MRSDAGVGGTPSADPGPARRPRGERTSAKLVAAAKQVFAERGLPDARIADIAKRAGVSYGSFYHYFDSKEALFRELADEVGALLEAPVATIIMRRDSTSSPQERLRQSLRHYYEAYRDEAGFLGVIEQATRIDDDVREHREQSAEFHQRQVAESIALLQRRGLADPKLDPAVAAAALGSMTSSFAEQWLAQGRLDPDFDTAVDTVTRLFISALGLDHAEAAAAS